MPKPYPDAPRGDVVDERHGVAVPDPYRWLEDADAPDTRRWIEAQNDLTEGWLADAQARSWLHRRLADLWDHARRGAPWRRGHRWFQMRNDGLQDQDVLWTMDAADDEGRVLLDPNLLSEDGTVSLTGTAVSRDGRLLAYATSAAGSDWRTWRVRDVETCEDHDDVVEWSKFSPAAWLPDGSGFLYGAYDPPREDEAYEAQNLDQRLQLHELGTPQSSDRVVIATPDHPEWGFDPEITDDGRVLVVTVWHGTHPENQVWVVPLTDDGSLDEDQEFVHIVSEADASYVQVAALDGVLYVLTDLHAPRRRLVAVDLQRPEREHWREIVATTDATLERASLIGGRLVLCYLDDARHRLEVVDREGEPVSTVELPGTGTVEEIRGEPDDEAAHLTFETFTSPAVVVRHDIDGGATQVVDDVAIDLDPDAFITEQVKVTSDDGTLVPLFLTRRVDIEPDGRVPTILWGYGGFQIPITPTFKVPWAVWLEAGGMVAVACLRGGGEYGQEWHDAGRLGNKTNVFDDFNACAKWLASSGWTGREHLGIEGRSNGGLLVGACMTRRPDLFGSCVAEVGVMDMLRFHLFTIGWGWTSDYGDPDDPDDFAVLRSYSPYHNVREGACYPPTLVTTGDHDDRVVPGHSFKFTAALQHAQACDFPVLARIDTSAGHGEGKPVSKLIDERADVLAFHARCLGLDVPTDVS